MTGPPGSRSRVTDEEIVAALEHGLSVGAGAPVRVVGLTRAVSRYATSATIEEIVATVDDGSVLQLVLKDLSHDAQLDVARRIKPQFVRDPRRELATYRQVLAGRALATAACHATVADEPSGRFWMLLEKVPGVELFQVGELADWQHAAAWLARLHAAAGPDVERLAHDAHLLVHDRAWHRCWSKRARAHLTATAVTAATVDWLLAGHEAAVETLLSLPRSIIHGEFYASNVLVAPAVDGVRICPVDWEMTALGCGLTDLAALTSGQWGPADREQIALAYRAALPKGATRGRSPAEFMSRLDAARLAQCVLLIGWSPGWSPPVEHTHDWLAEALAAAERIEAT